MIQVHPACGLPFCQNPKDIQTNFSVGLRISAVVLGTLAIIVAGLIVLNIPGLNHIGTTGGWTLVSIGTVLVLVGISVKCVKDKSQITDEDEPQFGISESQKLKNEEKGTQKEKKTVSSKLIPKKQTPQALISLLPKWLLSCVTDVPYLQLPDKPVSFEDLKTVSYPITLFSAGPTVGIHIRLRVNHMSIDSSYDRTRKFDECAQKVMKISSRNPFILHIIAWRRATDDTLWILTSERYPHIEHRNAPFDIGNVLGDNCFNFYSDDLLEQEVIEQFVNTERQDDLAPKYRQHLGWILLKLFKDGHLEVREKRTDRIYHSFDDPAVGYWKISIDKATV
jgi:hypothetical protein